MNGFQFRVAISVAAAAASTCCSPARNNSSPPRQRSTQCCSLKQQSMWENIEERWCYTSRRLLSISIPAYCAGKRRPLCKNTAAENSGTTGATWLAGSAVNQTLKPFNWLVLLRAGPIVDDGSVTVTVTVTKNELNVILLTLWCHEDFYGHIAELLEVYFSVISFWKMHICALHLRHKCLCLARRMLRLS